MSWFMVNIASALLALISLSVFVVIARKLATTIQMGRELAKQVHIGTSCLDRAILALREEHQDFRDENRKMDARIIESTRIRREIDRSIAHMEEVRNQLQNDFNLLRNLPTVKTQEHAATLKTTQTYSKRSIFPKKFPVFVQRSAQKALLHNTIQPTASKNFPVFVQHKTQKASLHSKTQF
ncbi:BAB2_0123 family type IV secretion system effector [Bartonella bacilliformis]|uniref:Uncharacterized protein n=2 Tax=Bartonella bacilliformis TaxID=774 RepID=A0A072QXD8_BARBA|nr:hypothetical protein [Bartonella bacilliformis]KEG18333.1 hypothetical protein H710_01182 [Bartonella bacilliformis Ver097]